MRSADWIALVTPAIAVCSIGVAAIVKLTRLVDAVERLAEAMENVTRTLGDHELRIGMLEQRRRPRHGRSSATLVIVTKMGGMAKRTSVAIPASWQDRIRRLAAGSHRSMHGEILWLLGLGLAAEESRQPGQQEVCSNDTTDRR